ncbi:hypothetical protein COU37_00820 [Candidatus Micrarchaeota archaeon CG10_big_fil_rev_8_21_14_0_10_45_29]|nr:MAG: hypothetical protein COU37_00820 [Candidatus Micrarchaeota archaeon CG10_big_fil_rev_8_21_14_0_10_45_29]
MNYGVSMHGESGKANNITDVAYESDTDIISYCDTNNKVMIAFIATYAPARISPIERARMSIGLSEEFGFEQMIDEIEKKNNSKPEAVLLINSPGGLVESSYKIAKILSQTFSKITVCVPHIAASGGTLIALTGTEIVLGPMSQLSPIDIQTGYGDFSMSVNHPINALGRLNDYFKDKSAEESPYPMKALADRLDPFVIESCSGLRTTMYHYALNILKQNSNYKNKSNIQDIVQKLLNYPCHDYVIDSTEAINLGLPVIQSKDNGDLWKLSKKWLAKYMLETRDKHIIRYCLPNNNQTTEKVGGDVGGGKNAES